MVAPNPWRVEPLLRLFARLLASFAAGVLLAGLLRSWLGSEAAENTLLPLIISIVCIHGAGLVFITLFLREQEAGWSEAFGLNKQTGWALALGVGLAILALPACWWIQSEMARGLANWGFDVSEQDTVLLLRKADVLWKQALLFVFAVLVAPVAEEAFFRGILYPLLKAYSHRGFALLASAVLFALIHNNIVVLLPLIFLAVLLALLYEWTGNLLACIVVHGLFNGANFVMLFALKNAGQLPGNP